MSTKAYIWIGITAGSIIGGWIGGLFDHGNIFGIWGFTLGTVGAFAGIWAGFKLGQ